MGKIKFEFDLTPDKNLFYKFRGNYENTANITEKIPFADFKLDTICFEEIPPAAVFDESVIVSSEIKNGSIYHVYATNYTSPSNVPTVTNTISLGELQITNFFDYIDFEKVELSSSTQMSDEGPLVYSHGYWKAKENNKILGGYKIFKFNISGLDWEQFYRAGIKKQAVITLNGQPVPISVAGVRNDIEPYQMDINISIPITSDIGKYIITTNQQSLNISGKLTILYLEVLTSNEGFVIYYNIDIKTSEFTWKFDNSRNVKEFLKQKLSENIQFNVQAQFTETKQLKDVAPFLEGKYLDPALPENDMEHVYKTVNENANTQEQLNRYAKMVNYSLAPKEYIQIKIKANELDFHVGNRIKIGDNLYFVESISYEDGFVNVTAWRKLNLTAQGKLPLEKEFIKQLQNMQLKKGVLIGEEGDCYLVKTNLGELKIPKSNAIVSEGFVYWR